MFLCHVYISYIPALSVFFLLQRQSNHVTVNSRISQKKNYICHAPQMGAQSQRTLRIFLELPLNRQLKSSFTIHIVPSPFYTDG